MSIVEPFFSRRSGDYIVSDREDSIPADMINPRAPLRDAPQMAEGANQEEEVSKGNLRTRLGRTCCSCVSNMPTVMLVVGLLALLIICLTVIPAVFLLSNASSSQKQVSSAVELENEIFQEGHMKPSLNEFDYDEGSGTADSVLGLSMEVLLPINVSLCHGFGFTCTQHPNTVISTMRRCDGVVDCPDASDENRCNECQTPFWCALSTASHTRICLTAGAICDGVRHCPDGSDEKKYCGPDCEEDELSCTTQLNASICVPKDSICDGIENCSGGEDEKECIQCTGGAKMCASTKQCVAARFVCDGVIHCLDGSDEQECDCRSCSGSANALCDDGTCLHRSLLCDGRSHCSKAMDELGCPGSCALDKKIPLVRCSDGDLYLETEACSGHLPHCASACPKCDDRLSFTCSDRSCVPRNAICDGKNDCSDGEDEKDCQCQDVEEGSGGEDGEWRCDGGSKCVSAEQRCDGLWDCLDGSDEMECDECPSWSVRCEESKSCLPPSARCNGAADCPDGSDETNCTCDECLGLHSDTYLCAESARCFRRHEVCAPYSLCPNATDSDKVFCAAQALLGHL